MKQLKIVIPKGRLNKKVVRLLNDVGLGIEIDERCYIPQIDAPDFKVKIMKPQNIPQLIEVGSHDVGFTGCDWMIETGADVKEIIDLGFDPVTIAAAVPESLSKKELFSRKIVVASEYQEIARTYLDQQGYDYYFIRTFGATEVFPPEDADMIIDNMSSGRTLEKHKLKVVHQITTSSTRMIANKQALADPIKKRKIDELVMLIQAVLDARDRVMVEMNIPGDKLEVIVRELPCMRAPTVAPLFNGEGYAVKIAVKKSQSARLIPQLKELGATDILEYDMRKVII